ncbi:MAG: PAS domain-containing protein, partial [Blastococcus sp.]
MRPDEDGPWRGQVDFLAGVPDAVYRLDSDGRFTYMNAAAETLLECRAEDVLSRPLFDCFPAARGSLMQAHFRDAVAEGRPQQFDYFYEPQDRWYEVRAFPDPTGLAVFFRDVDAHHRDDQRRDTEIRQLTAVLEALPSATVLVDG